MTDENSTTTSGDDSTDSSDQDHTDYAGDHDHGHDRDSPSVRARATATERDAEDRDRPLDGVPAPSVDVTLTVQVPPPACQRITDHLTSVDDPIDRAVVLDHLDAQVNLQQQYRTADGADAVEAILPEARQRRDD